LRNYSLLDDLGPVASILLRWIGIPPGFGPNEIYSSLKVIVDAVAIEVEAVALIEVEVVVDIVALVERTTTLSQRRLNRQPKQHPLTTRRLNNVSLAFSEFGGWMTILISGVYD